MEDYRFSDHQLYDRLVKHAQTMHGDDHHLRQLIKADQRMAEFSAIGGGIFFDYSRQRVDASTMRLLLALADAAAVMDQFADMASGKKVNVTENRAALHMAARSFSDVPVRLDGRDVKPDLKCVLEEIRTFSETVHRGETTGSTGQAFRHVVVVGIGGSYLGTEFVARALEAFADKGISLEFLANVDVHNFGCIWSRIQAEQTLWIIISKSYTTAETMANEDLIRRYMDASGLDPSKHLVTVTSKGSPGDQGAGQGLAAFHMFDFIGGRYSVSSAVGGVPLSLYLGYERFERFLKGAEEMDRHALEAAPTQNLPLIAALLSVWNTSFLGYPQTAIIPYASPLCKLAPHVQQLNMESNGKSVDSAGRLLAEPAGTVIFGEPGTNAQHSFFQLAHQGKAFPIDFIGVLNPQYQMDEGSFKGVGHQQELWANMLAQATALASGRKSENPAKSFSGNRPSSSIVLENLDPENVGRLLAFYEARTIYEAFIWGINPFDQFGVELGKLTAGTIRSEMAARNQNPGHDFAALDPINRAYLQMLFKGKFPG
ncbi:glucose-6-phosphate isomerase [Desulfosarcina sp.]|uniref:glucose-6-phosphate isomerase n=1 Tax=Desulfosarcina sp. TaxID=2027861 RepID=UPI0029BB47F3|nr:glucose-6-phosphate isomerase [Desulfosarcina sp.]MDX2451577.1 glucose-6-phosphate isomerase [Desulfosarcina sp.]